MKNKWLFLLGIAGLLLAGCSDGEGEDAVTVGESGKELEKSASLSLESEVSSSRPEARVLDTTIVGYWVPDEAYIEREGNRLEAAHGRRGLQWAILDLLIFSIGGESITVHSQGEAGPSIPLNQDENGAYSCELDGELARIELREDDLLYIVKSDSPAIVLRRLAEDEVKAREAEISETR